MSMASGLESHTDRKYHWDISAILVSLQEVYFGHETQVNVSLIETVTLGDGTKRVYLSPTKRRGVERRALLYAPVDKNGESKYLTDLLNCGIPNTCGKENCPICRVYGALVTGGRGNTDRTTFVGRLTHGGGVAIPPLPPEEKQRAMHPSNLRRQGGEEPVLFKREYGAPGLLFPVYNHLLAASEKEFQAVAHAFLESLPRLGAGNPKGLALLEDVEGPYLVVDRYLSPLGKRVVLSPMETDPEKAKAAFRRLAQEYKDKEPLFRRFVGQAALEELQRLSEAFVAGLEEY